MASHRMMGAGPASLRDRTADFQAIAARLARQAGAPVPELAAGPPAPVSAAHAETRAAVSSSSEFARRAAQIGLSIHATSTRLHKLAALAKRSSMFDDPTAEIDELTGIIKQDIQGLNAAIAELQRTGAAARGADNKQSADHSVTVVNNLRSRLKDATQEFKDVLTNRTDALRAHKQRRALFSAAPDAPALLLERTPLLGGGGAPVGGGLAGSAPLVGGSTSFGTTGTAAGMAGGGGSSSSSSSRPSAAALFGGQAQGVNGGSQQLQVQALLPQEAGYTSARAEALANVESTIVELGSIFTQLAELVQAQGEATRRIDENVDETLGNVDAAKAQLAKYLAAVSSNRGLMLKVFGVLMLFLIIFITLVA